jgi:hypothetical protein
MGHCFNRISVMSTEWHMTESERKQLIDGLKYWHVVTSEMMKMAKLFYDVLKGNRQYDDQVQIEIKKLMRFPAFVAYINEHKIDPFTILFARMYDKYDIPSRLEKRNNSYKKSQDFSSE